MESNPIQSILPLCLPFCGFLRFQTKSYPQENQLEFVLVMIREPVGPSQLSALVYTLYNLYNYKSNQTLFILMSQDTYIQDKTASAEATRNSRLTCLWLKSWRGSFLKLLSINKPQTLENMFSAAEAPDLLLC